MNSKLSAEGSDFARGGGRNCAHFEDNSPWPGAAKNPLGFRVHITDGSIVGHARKDHVRALREFRDAGSYRCALFLEEIHLTRSARINERLIPGGE